MAARVCLRAKRKRQRVKPINMERAPQSKKARMSASMVKMQVMVMAYLMRDSAIMCSLIS